MFKSLQKFVAACYYYSGLVKLTRWWTQYSGEYLIILNYHCATGGDLRRHLMYLRQRYRLLHLEEALEELYSPHKREKEVHDRRTPLVLTFDDGYQDNYTHLFVLARELQIPVTIFLIPGYIENHEYFWWLEGKRLVQRAQVDQITIEDHTYHLSDPKERSALARVIDARLRYAQSVAEREEFLKTVREMLAVLSNTTLEEEATLPLTWAQVFKMKESGLVSFGAHTMHHPILTYLADPQEVQHEVGQCRERLEELLKLPVRTFAYPVGRPQHVKETFHTVQQAGYAWALTTTYGFNTSRTNPYLLRRIEVDASQHWLVMAVEVAGLWNFFSWLRWVLKKKGQAARLR